MRISKFPALFLDFLRDFRFLEFFEKWQKNKPSYTHRRCRREMEEAEEELRAAETAAMHHESKAQELVQYNLCTTYLHGQKVFG